MISKTLQKKLADFFILDREEYQNSHNYLPIEDEKKSEIKKAAIDSIKNISLMDEQNGYIKMSKLGLCVKPT